MRTFRHKRAAASVYCHRSYNSLKDKRYHTLVTTVSAEREEINSAPNLLRCVSVFIILFVSTFFPHIQLLFANKRKQYLAFGSIIFKTNTIVGPELKLIVVDFQFSLRIEFIAVMRSLAAASRETHQIGEIGLLVKGPQPL